jgi:hypothetical protein
MDWSIHVDFEKLAWTGPELELDFDKLAWTGPEVDLDRKNFEWTVTTGKANFSKLIKPNEQYDGKSYCIGKFCKVEFYLSS